MTYGPPPLDRDVYAAEVYARRRALEAEAYRRARAAAPSVRTGEPGEAGEAPSWAAPLLVVAGFALLILRGLR